MTIQEKLEILMALDDSFTLRYRDAKFCRMVGRDLLPWYTDQQVEIKQGSVLVSVSGNGMTQDDAIRDHWNQVTQLQPGEYVVVKAGTPDRQAVQWNGFMWKNVHENRRG